MSAARTVISVVAPLMPPYVNPSGEQYEIAAGPYRAVIAGVGATLRELTHGDRPLIDGFGTGEMATGGRGQLLVPWPNRIRDGRYRFDGSELQLPLSEPSRGNASHGLVRWAGWGLLEHGADRVRLEHSLHPQPGYPFSLRLRIVYALAAAGLQVSLEVLNAGAGEAPFGAGFHPYLVAGPGPVDGWRLQVPAEERLLTDDRMLPVGREAVDGRFDFRHSRPIGNLKLDTCFTRLSGSRITVEGERRVELRIGEGFSHVMVFSGDGLAARARMGLAVEPMTCAPDAFNSGDGLQVLAPGEEVKLDWGIAQGT